MIGMNPIRSRNPNFVTFGGRPQPTTLDQMNRLEQLRQEQLRTDTGEWGLQREKEAWALQKQQAGATAELTKQFLGQWGVGMENLKGLYDKILSGESGGAAGPLGDLTNKVLEEYESFKTEYQPLEREFFDQARNELGVRKELVGQMQNLATPDYEGAAGQAAADVTSRSEIGRQAEVRRMEAMGVDPTSGKFGALTRRSHLEEARNTAVAMNLARRGEKERVAGLTGEALQLTDPRITSSVGLGLQEQRTGMLKTTADIARASADVERSRADIANSYAQNVVRPYGDIGFTLLGRQIGQGTYTPSTLPSTLTGPSTPTQQPVPSGSTSTGAISRDPRTLYNTAAAKGQAIRRW